MSTPTASLTDSLRESDCFRGLSDEALSKVVPLCQSCSFSQGEEIVHEMDPGETLFIIVSGVVDVEISRPLDIGEGIQVGPLKPGACFGEISLVDGFFRSASVRARTDVEVVYIADSDLRALFDSDHEIGFVFMLNIAGILSRRIRDANIRLRNAVTGLYV
ncbi:MAG: cyclic nucleotide-binding domain-containing protein [Myxococcota bacterium]|nr:cyclic nucleotide-binding domain-containing protein [Myxococcota bacterium]